MALSTLETTLRKKGCLFDRKKDGSVVGAFDHGPHIQPVIFFTEQHGHVSGKISFPLPSLPDMEGFCNELRGGFPDNCVSVAYSLSEKNLTFLMYAEVGEAYELGVHLAELGSLFAPLHKRLLDDPVWDDYLVALALSRVDQYCGGIQ